MPERLCFLEQLSKPEINPHILLREKYPDKELYKIDFFGKKNLRPMSVTDEKNSIKYLAVYAEESEEKLEQVARKLWGNDLEGTLTLKYIFSSQDVFIGSVFNITKRGTRNEWRMAVFNEFIVAPVIENLDHFLISETEIDY